MGRELVKEGFLKVVMIKFSFLGWEGDYFLKGRGIKIMCKGLN